MTQSPDKDSLEKRYLYKLSTNFVGFAINLITQAIIPRGLGPRAYGNFNFLTNFFSQLVGFLDMGTSVGFYTKISQRQKEFGLISSYMWFSLVVSLITIVFVVTAVSTKIYLYLWPEQAVLYIALAAVWGILTWFVQNLNKMGDAYGLTVSSELARIFQRILGFALILPLFFFNKLTLVNFFFTII